MRDLHVVGLGADGKFVVCADPKTGDRFRLPADDKLRAASRGDIARLGQIEIEMDSLLRPKEIQARIRSGATIEQVAADSGMAVSRVEVFAHPVLLERSQAASMAQAGHPLRHDGPAVQTLLDIVTLAFRARGHNLDDAEWDAWRDEDNKWVAQLKWQAGRTTNKAHWQFLPDGHGGTIAPLDDTAHELIDPDFGRQLRGLAPVRALAPASADDEASQQSFDEYYGTTSDSELDAETVEIEADETPAPEVDQPHEPVARDPKPALKAAPGHGGKDKRGKPAMPSWEDVLLGVRSSGHN
ncbi:DNA-binding protein [Rhodococcus sp. 14-2483-1-1]|uniref:septation protein SepH n=1 Tax=Rhodococcus sp. 14-2483-1-1 TaxID=2023148 RepID=UPI000B9BD40A|nr:septation protein SepH [Rhodococcus sp. 14-2483-1-1]OZF40861.1 DNA-binding protein [Rhodococcus sp. 14-2483-1-1]